LATPPTIGANAPAKGIQDKKSNPLFKKSMQVPTFDFKPFYPAATTPVSRCLYAETVEHKD
jgi:hypothetical protein